MAEIQVHENPRLEFIPTLEETITRTVKFHAGIRDTDLTISVLVEIADHPELKQKTGFYVASLVAGTVNRMIAVGQLIAIDCNTSGVSYTYVLPADARLSMAMPIMMTENQTRH